MTTSTQNGKGGKSPQDAVSYAVGHRIRVEIITALHDLDSVSAIELARIVHQPLSTVTHHINELLKSGAIQVKRTEKVRSVEQRFYSVVRPIFISDEEMEELPEEERQGFARMLLQSLIAEALSSFWAGKITTDPRLFLSWSWFNVDEQGRADIADEQFRSWQRIREIEREAEARCAKSGKERFSVLLSSFSFPRSRTAARPTPQPKEM
jgi:DNA-binding transcriptional ArsR family regulator